MNHDQSMPIDNKIAYQSGTNCDDKLLKDYSVHCTVHIVYELPHIKYPQPHNPSMATNGLCT